MNAAAPKDPKTPPEDPVGRYDARRMAFFHFMFSRFFGKHMRAARVARWGLPDGGIPGQYGDRPLVVFANHPGWWDGVAFMMLSMRLFPGRRMFIPMEKAALDRYAFMRRLGVFGVEGGSPRGAIAFLRTARQVLGAPDRMLWMNAPGRFSDVRERPVPIAVGMTRLPEMAPDALFIPLALDYPFWTERKAEMLCAFGPPIEGAALAATEREARARALSEALAATMDRLAEDAISRDPDRFVVLQQGREGMGGVYDLWRRARAGLRGERFDPRHDPRAPATPPGAAPPDPRRDAGD